MLLSSISWQRMVHGDRYLWSVQGQEFEALFRLRTGSARLLEDKKR